MWGKLWSNMRVSSPLQRSVDTDGVLFRLIIIVAGTWSRADVDEKKKTRRKMLAANDIQHAEHVICMMTTGNFNEAFVFFPPSKPGSGRNEQSSACLYSVTDYSCATRSNMQKIRKKHSWGSQGQLIGRCRWINAECCHVSPCFYFHRSGSGTSVPSFTGCSLRVCGFSSLSSPARASVLHICIRCVALEWRGHAKQANLHVYA